MSVRRPHPIVIAALLASSVAVTACGGSAATPSSAAQATSAAPSVAPATSAPATSAPATSPAAAPSAQESTRPTAAPAASIPTGPATLDGPASVEGGKSFQVAWTGPNAPRDYVTIVAKGTGAWTNESFFYTTAGSPGTLVAPTTAGDYELRYVSGTDDSIATRRPITVTAFEGTLAAPSSVVAGTEFSVGWTGPDGDRDYVTIVAKGAERWTNESFVYTKDGSSGKLVAPITAGPYEIWYVTGVDSKTMARAPITVTPLAITLSAPASVAKSSQFEVAWTGPNGPSDYITIVPAGAADGTYTNYAYTRDGSPARLTAPDAPGKYEIRYASDRVPGTFARAPIEVK
jgi:Ca-activated chloride channel family protein